jgi:hypothetical protein
LLAKEITMDESINVKAMVMVEFGMPLSKLRVLVAQLKFHFRLYNTASSHPLLRFDLLSDFVWKSTIIPFPHVVLFECSELVCETEEGLYEIEIWMFKAREIVRKAIVFDRSQD